MVTDRNGRRPEPHPSVFALPIFGVPVALVPLPGAVKVSVGVAAKHPVLPGMVTELTPIDVTVPVAAVVPPGNVTEGAEV
jgi:hypothetical protein